MTRTVIGLITWRPHLAAVTCGLLVALWVLWGLVIYRNLCSRMSARRGLLLTILRMIVVGMLVVAVLDPFRSRSISISAANKVLALLDVSSSMDVKDHGTLSRVERARAALKKIGDALPPGLSLKTLEFDTELREPGRRSASENPAGVRDTDLGGSLQSLARRLDLSSHAAIILLTDGGDEPVENIEMPPIPLYVVGIGSDLSGRSDIAVRDVRFPSSIEKDAAFEISVDIAARNPEAFADRNISRLPLTLEREQNGQWRKDGEQLVDLSKGWLQTAFKTSCRSPGLQTFRISLPKVPGEVSFLNNTRMLSMDVRKKSLHVLFFARELGMELKMLRGELARDPGVTFTALFRTIGERFTLQGERFPGDEGLESGFPREADVLKPFDCVIIGSVSGKEWRDAQMTALRTYVESGGAAIFLGDESSFGPGGYASTALAPLIPWEPSGVEQDLLRGDFAVSIPAACANHPIVAGMNDLLTGSSAAAVESVSPVGHLRAGAMSLMTVVIGQRSIPFIAVQRYGKGMVLALASNTLWKWARKSNELQKAYGLFWRQAVRNLASNSEGGQILSIKWDKEFYRPGEKAAAEIRTSVGQQAHDLLLTASLAANGQVSQIPVEPLQGQAGTFSVRLAFEKRGACLFRLAAHQGNNVLETYDKTFQVGPHLGEGARLELDSRSLAKLAKSGGGRYVEERDVDELVQDLTARHPTKDVTSDVSLLSGTPWFTLAFLAVGICEWMIRRRMNLF